MKKETTILLLVLSAFICLAVACGNDVSPPHEHSFSKDWVSNDEEHWHAATCGHNLKEDVSSHSFKWVSGSFTGTCTQTGEAERECTECGRKVTGSVIGSHSFNESGICSICNGYKCGDDVAAIFDPTTKTMTFKGKGQTYNFISNYGDKEGSSKKIWGEDVHAAIVEAVFEDGITNIGNCFLNYATSLQKVVVGKDIEVIGENSFEDCKNLSSLVFKGPSRVRNIKNYAFWKSSLKNVILPDSVRVLGSGAFRDTGLESITLNEGLERIHLETLWGGSFDTLNLPSTLNPIIPGTGYWEGGCFLGMYKNLKKFTVAEGNPYMKATEDGSALVSIDGSKLLAVAAGASDYKNIPSGTKVIGAHAFYFWTGTNIVVPEGVETIEKQAFRNCKNLLTVELPSSLTSIEIDAFIYCEKLATITVHKPEGSLEGAEVYWSKTSSGPSIAIPPTIVWED